MNSETGLTVGAIAQRFGARPGAREGGQSQQAVYKFARWLGWDRPISSVTAAQVAGFADFLPPGADTARDIEPVRSFLAYARKEGYVQTNLAAQLKIRRARSRRPSGSHRKAPPPVPLTRQGYDDLVSQLGSLKERRTQVTADIHRAAADKDFRENAPLHAAREERGHIDGRIMELEQTLKSATLIGDKALGARQIVIGDTVILEDPSSGEETTYTIVSSREVDIKAGRISTVSPLGKAIVGKTPGQIIEVDTPAGRLRFCIKERPVQPR
jgi:transcription elongation factor GreA